jgi:hypothetical protein
VGPPPAPGLLLVVGSFFAACKAPPFPIPGEKRELGSYFVFPLDISAVLVYSGGMLERRWRHAAWQALPSDSCFLTQKEPFFFHVQIRNVIENKWGRTLKNQLILRCL